MADAKAPVETQPNVDSTPSLPVPQAPSKPRLSCVGVPGAGPPLTIKSLQKPAVVLEPPKPPPGKRLSFFRSKLFMSKEDPPTPEEEPPIGMDEKLRQASTASIGEGELFSWGSQRDKGGHNLALYEEASVPFISNYLKAYTTPGPAERAQSKKKKADLGVMLGVYLPTIQHILGVTMFIRLFWLVGIAGIGQTFLLLFLCCLCTFLTTISLSAVATNGVVESGGIGEIGSMQVVGVVTEKKMKKKKTSEERGWGEGPENAISTGVDEPNGPL